MTEKKMTIDELRRQVAWDDEHLGEDLDAEAREIVLNMFDCDERATLQVLMALADELIHDYERHEEGKMWSLYVLMALGTGTLPDGSKVTPGRVFYVGYTMDPELRALDHAQDARRHAVATTRPAVSVAIEQLALQGVGFYLHPTASRLTIAQAKTACEATTEALRKAGKPIIPVGAEFPDIPREVYDA